VSASGNDPTLKQPAAQVRVVSPNNPCPFLRALVADGRLDGHRASLSVVARVVCETNGGAAPEERLPQIPVFLIALIANGLAPSRLVRNLREGAQLDGLRGGPLDKRGAGSRILDGQGQIDEAQIARLDEFASDQSDGSGQVERGLNRDQIEAMMDANFARAAGRRRRIDRLLMNGEWPILLKIMGKNVGRNRYLSVSEVRALFVERRLPDRLLGRRPPATD
jgi:hypothetical protein